LDFFKSLLNELYGNENRIYRPEIGKPVVLGGFDVVMDCIASDNSIDDSVRLASPNGKVILVGMPSIRVELTGHQYGIKTFPFKALMLRLRRTTKRRRKKTIQIAIDLLTEHQRN
jgi:threonine dehydrogenase-like Zn-dependent dehydrogenase